MRASAFVAWGSWGSLGLAVVALAVSVLASVHAGCGPKLFPDCGKPGVECPPCPERATYPDPCAAGVRDAGADGEAGK